MIKRQRHITRWTSWTLFYNFLLYTLNFYGWMWITPVVVPYLWSIARFSLGPQIEIKAAVSSILRLRDPTSCKRAFLFCSTVPVKAESHHLSSSGTLRQPRTKNSLKFFMLPPREVDTIALTFVQCGGGFAFEYWVRLEPRSDGGAENPLVAQAIAGGTVMRPILKQASETTTAWTMAPSGSSVNVSLATAIEVSCEVAERGRTDGASTRLGREVWCPFWAFWCGPSLCGAFDLDVSDLLLWDFMTNLWTQNIYCSDLSLWFHKY